jgi:hypothetical protein
MALDRWFTKRVLLLFAVGAIAVAAQARAAAADAGPQDARATAGTVTLQWLASVPVNARVGAEPVGDCRTLDGGRPACTIGIVVLAHDRDSRRPWRCSATAVVSGVGDELRGRRTNTRCVPFPPFTEVAEPAGQLGTALALHANGDVSCLRAGGRRVTCVMGYRGANGTHCIGAVSVPVKRLERSVALGAPRCD